MAGVMKFAGQVMKNFFHKPVTKNYPAEPIVYTERNRGHIEIDIDECISCGMCVRSCPPGCLAVSKADGTWTINRFDCIACGYCVLKCPKKCLHLVPGYQEPGTEKKPVTYTKSPEQMEKERIAAEERAKKMAAAKAARQAAAKKKAAAAAAAAKPAAAAETGAKPASTSKAPENK